MKEYYSIDELSDQWKIPALDILYTIQSRSIPVYMRYIGYVRIVNALNFATYNYNNSFLKINPYHMESFYFHLIEKKETEYNIFSFSTENSGFIGDRLIAVTTNDLTSNPPPESYEKSYQSVTINNVFIFSADFALFGLSLTHIKSPADFSDKERKNLYKTIGLLTKALVNSKGNILGTTEKPVINQIAIELSKQLPSDDTGLKDRAVRERIKKGLDYLDER